MSEMIERVAEALSEADTATTSYKELARVAIEAMRKPTEEMNDAGRNNNYHLYATAAWEAMIDAALKEQTK